MQSIQEKTDQELVTATLADKQAFSEIVSRYELPMRRYVKRLGCVDKNDADDVLQEIFIKVFINLNGYDSGLKFSSWLYRIAHNETISFFRKKKIRPAALNLSTEDAENFFERLVDEQDFLDLAERRHDAVMAQKVLAALDQKYREVIVLRFLEGKSYTEISDILKIPEGTVGTLINRGKKALKVALSAKGLNNL